LYEYKIIHQTRIMKNIILLSSFILLMLAAGSCVKKENSPTPNNQYHREYFSATFNNYFLPNETGIMLFLSDSAGNLLAQADLNGITHVYLRPENGGLFPEHLTETLVYKGPVVDGKVTIFLYSYLQILPASWNWTTFESVDKGTVGLSFNNIPSHTGFILSSYYQWMHSDTLNPSLYLDLGRDPDNIYMAINTITTGFRYKWITNVSNTHTYSVDLSNTTPTLNKTIPVPPTMNCSYQLSGYLPAGEHAKGLYPLDFGELSGSNTDSVTLHFPATLFADFQFFINTADPSDPHKQWYQYNFGLIPDRIDHLNGDITIVNSAPGSFQVSTTGTFDRVGSTWKCDPIGPNRYQWTVFGSPAATTFRFPSLPAELESQFVGLVTDSLKLSSVEIKDFAGLNSYDNLIKSMFVSGEYIANLVPQYSGLIYNVTPEKSGIRKNKREKDF
jgi:hypothetical protein